MLRGITAYVRRHHIALLALFFALGGTAFAAGNALLPNNSVGSAQVINGSLQKSDLSGKAVRALKGNRGLRGTQGTPGAAGPQGPAGPQGVQGPAGPAGTAVAYANVAPGGTLETNAPPAKNIANGNLTHPATGIYCVTGLAFTPQSAVASAGNIFVTGAAMATVSVDGRATPGLDNCPGARVRVRIYNGAGTLVDWPFTIWLQ